MSLFEEAKIKFEKGNPKAAAQFNRTWEDFGSGNAMLAVLEVDNPEQYEYAKSIALVFYVHGREQA